MDDLTSELGDLDRKFNDTEAQPIKISYATIKYITKDFAQEIGDGGFGVVYLGSLRNGMVAVKKLLNSKDLSHKKFSDEVACLTKANHRNIVRFIGYCSDTQEKTYGYEWSVRYQIIKGICHGLHCIHKKDIIHLDLKPANVLIGANMEQKITDFGLSRLIDKGQCTIETKNCFGTWGYIAPELIDGNKYSFQSDIYSLGVTIINLLTGRNGSFRKEWHETIDEDCPQMKGCIEIAKNCVNKDPHKRPTTGEIINSLNEAEILFEKNPPIIKEPRYDPDPSLCKVVQIFQALPAVTLGIRSRVDTIHTELDVPECLLKGGTKPGKISYQLLLSITRNFSDEQLIGYLRFGRVYEGILPQRSIAVRKYSKHDKLDQIFRRDVEAMTMARHKNIMQFLGYCSYTEEETAEYNGKFDMAEIQERLLCYEYCTNRELARYISDASCGLEWRVRYDIIKGICEGLHYLHMKHILHMDLEPTIILLDHNMVPKIAEYCVTRSFYEHGMYYFGSAGYMAPESQDREAVSLKSDIYSLGVIINEILTGQKRYIARGRVLGMWKKRLETSSPDTVLLEQVQVCFDISMACREYDPEKRPDIQHIIDMLVETETNGAETVKTLD